MRQQIPQITGQKTFDIEVDGHREFQDILVRLSVDGSMTRDGVNFIAELVMKFCGTGALASIEIEVDGVLVGRLTHHIASEFHRAVVDGGLADYSRFRCDATFQASNDKLEPRLLRIWLDLPQDGQPTAAPSTDKVTIQCSQPKTNEVNPLVNAFRNEAIIDRQIDELIGIIKGVMADGMVTQGEVEFLLTWMDANRKAAHMWPAKAIYPRLAEAIDKGTMSIEKESEILDLLMKTVGGNTGPRYGHLSDSSALPYTQPLEPLSFEGRNFCFTGVFASGTRKWCQEQVERRGGTQLNGITKKLHYLVIGDIGNENWLHSTHGRKIEKAISYNTTGSSIIIVGEEHWYNHL